MDEYLDLEIRFASNASKTVSNEELDLIESVLPDLIRLMLQDELNDE